MNTNELHTPVLHHGDCLDVMRSMADNSVDSVVTDPPYGIRFMGKAWDGADIEARASERRAAVSHDPVASINGGHKSVAAEAGKYDLTPQAMRDFQEFSLEWAREAFRVLKPGGHLLSFASSRTYHRMTSGVEDAGFEIRDQIMWVFGSGFPKSLNISKAIDKAVGAEREVVSSGAPVKRMIPGADQDKTGSWIKDSGREYVPSVTVAATEDARQWEGWGTALKPAHEPICVARKPLEKGLSNSSNILKWGTGGLNIDACRVSAGGEAILTFDRVEGNRSRDEYRTGTGVNRRTEVNGRFPANLIHDGSPDVVAGFPAEAGAAAPVRVRNADKFKNSYSAFAGDVDEAGSSFHGDSGSAARFFYCAKASRKDRNEGLVDPGAQFRHGTTLRKVEIADKSGNIHPTVKPTDLMAYLVRLVTPPGGVVLDPFMGSGSTGKAAVLEGFRFVGIELSAEYLQIAQARIDAAVLERAKATAQGALFGGAAA